MNNMINGNITSIEQMTESIGKNNSKNVSQGIYNGPSFADILQQKRSIEEVISDSNVQTTGKLKFSKHAGSRLEQRDIQLTDEQMSRLEEGTDKAISKGIKESLVLVDNLAFIVNTQNKTVITAMDQDTSEENIYTNIDGAVVI
ncbi:MAG: TIGR02530 family flagellar biosynthesis protein [Eubacteriales bacterium]|nr:TIGR02530 family flagellar biosynthesis protein [Eubacteriales bacterium]